ncbi:hypothetical protein AQUCO_03000035v1 [Aquilegia coerulea]|uniref:Uncharacterized protein n=1 Tax=Aquilegia coerulea TaxID=218851 RepID=A0A2G5D0Y5_AQUCA|nr:hypothetical protein AQUCO_03000035v1 [Aquilegia coerulea]
MHSLKVWTNCSNCYSKIRFYLQIIRFQHHLATLTPQNSAESVRTIQNSFDRSSDPTTIADFGDGVHIPDTYRSKMGHQRESFKLYVKI